MVYIKEYRICMPLTVEEYRIGQLYMIARHSHEQSENGEGVETVVNVPCEDDKYVVFHTGYNHSYQKCFMLRKRLGITIPLPLQCSFVPKLNVVIKTKFEDNRGENENALGLGEEQLKDRAVDFLDIAYDEVSAKHYKEEEDLRYFKSEKTSRGPLTEEWQKTVHPIMCSYKVVEASFEVWGMQTKCEDLIHRSIREILVLGHRQAFAWVDEWIDMSLADVRIYECEMQRETNTKVTNVNGTDEKKEEKKSSSRNSSSSSKTSSPSSPKTPILDKTPKSWFSWE